MRELLIRSATGLVYGLLLIGSALLHPIAFLIVYLVITVLAVLEFSQLGSINKIQPQILSTILLSAITFLVLFFNRYSGLGLNYLLIIPVLVILALIIEIFRNKNHPIMNLGLTYLGFIYVGVPMALFTRIVYNPYSDTFNPQLLIFLLMVIWLNDTGAYLVGKVIGRNKLFERISPKKTWEGLIGGIVVALIATAVFGPYFDLIPRPHQWIFTAGIVILGTFGDLTESMWKRAIGVKDSGNALPGHGGWLDRLDSLLFAVPAVYIISVILNNF